uniref:Unannotated protein n=1 Tax=freshwater metagenome TaxID=449393 RepID=A0A6J7PW42_9ZZZZ
MMPITDSRPIHGANTFAAWGRIGRAMRTKPYVPSFRRIAARMTEPCVGAWVWASGSQVWNGNIGTFTANPSAIPAKIRFIVVEVSPPSAYFCCTRSASSVMENVVPPVLKNRARNATSMNAEPNIVYRKNFSDAY